jgi:hypothetical protein
MMSMRDDLTESTSWWGRDVEAKREGRNEEMKKGGRKIRRDR